MENLPKYDCPILNFRSSFMGPVGESDPIPAPPFPRKALHSFQVGNHAVDQDIDRNAGLSEPLEHAADIGEC